MRLGIRGTIDGSHRGRSRRSRRRPGPLPLTLALLTVIGSMVVPGAPAGSAEPGPGAPDGGRFSELGDRDGERTVRRRSRSDGTRRGAPAQFVAEAGGRIVIVSARTGRVERPLTAPLPHSRALQPTAGSDGRRVWFSRQEGTCAAHLASVPVKGGAEKRMPGSGEAGPEGLPLPRPGRAHLAYARVDCEELQATLVVGDVEGLEGHGQMGLVPLGWNGRGDRLLATTTGGEVRLVEVNDRGHIIAIEALDPADPGGCRLGLLGFSPDGNDGYVAVRHCGGHDEAARRSLVLLDARGDLRRTVVRLPRGHAFVDHVAFDATGHSLLFSTAPWEPGDGRTVSGDDVSLWLWHEGTTRRLARQSPYRHPSWLP